ncbi:MAG: zinc ribbon domain-containing protein [Lachnospiraceae bacterium]|nr:zinc ribbon domain-containing protein [Lachnospiraceae bacterium]
MFCNNCGCELKDGAEFCPKCGTKQGAGSTGPATEIRRDPAPETDQNAWQGSGYGYDPAPVPDDDKKKTKKKGKGGKVILALLMVLLIAASVIFGRLIPMPFFDKVSGSGNRMEGPGYSSADEAALAFATAYSKQDIEGMYKACAIESYAENMNLEKRLEWLQSWSPTLRIMAGDDPETTDCNANGRMSDLYNQYFYNMFMYTSHDPDSEFVNGYTVKIGDDGISMSEALDEINPVKVLKGKQIKVGEVKGTDILEYLRSDSDYYKDQIKKNEGIYGGDIEERIVEIDISGDEWYMFLDLVKYGDKWYVLNPGGTAAAIYGLAVSNGGMIMKDEIE